MPPRAGRTETIAVCGLIALLVVGRSLVFVLYEQVQFDADQAVMGLMAKHIAQWRAFPFYVYAENYLFAVESWLSAPFVGLLGTSVAALRVPLVLLNGVAGGLLVALLARELGLRPLVALVPALFFVAAPPVLSAELVTAIGGNVEPFVYALLLWITRARPIAFGLVFVVGFMNREFTAYAVSALLLVEALQGRLWQPAVLRQKAIVACVFAAGWQIARWLRMRADVLGPGTAGAKDALDSNVSVAVGFICPQLDPARIGANLVSLVTEQMGTLLGAAPFRLVNVNIVTPTTQGMWGLWPLFGAVMFGAVLRIAWLQWGTWRASLRLLLTSRTPAPSGGPWFALFLVVIGVQAGVMWALSRCGPLHPMTLRYALLAVLVPIAIVAWHLSIEPRALVRNLMVLFVIAWTGVSLRAHAALLAHYVSQSRPSEYRLIADELLARRVRYVRTDYWAAYMLDFFSDERIIATPTDYTRILEYERDVASHADRAVLLSRQPCPHAEPIRHWYLCHTQGDR